MCLMSNTSITTSIKVKAQMRLDSSSSPIHLLNFSSCIKAVPLKMAMMPMLIQVLQVVPKKLPSVSAVAARSATSFRLFRAAAAVSSHVLRVWDVQSTAARLIKAARRLPVL